MLHSQAELKGDDESRNWIIWFSEEITYYFQKRHRNVLESRDHRSGFVGGLNRSQMDERKIEKHDN